MSDETDGGPPMFHRIVGLVISLAVAATILAPAGAQANSYKRLYAFTDGTDGSFPDAGPTLDGNKLFGTTGVTVFSFDLKTQTETTLHTFTASEGEYPTAPLIAYNNLLYGINSAAGAYGLGTVFSVDPKTGSLNVLHAFQGGSDGYGPWAGLIVVNGVLYGTTESGGGSTNCKYGCGTIFAINLSTGAESIVYDFQAGTDGSYPQSDLINVGGTLFGTTVYGGSSGSCDLGSGNCGTVFAFNLSTGVEEVIYRFQGLGKDGAYPQSGLTIVNGLMYGTTYQGGSGTICGGGCGTIYSINPKSRKETVLYSFDAYNDGAFPRTDMVAIGSVLYGTTSEGGDCPYGAIFSYDTASGTEKTVFSFTGGKRSDTPNGIAIKGNTFYGTSFWGGAGKEAAAQAQAKAGGRCAKGHTGFGTIFSYKP